MNAAEGGAPAPGVRLSYGFGTDRGLRRELNEDSFLAADPLFAVADGMGGHEAGEVASRECIQTLSSQSVLAAGSREATAAQLHQALQLADTRIREFASDFVAQLCERLIAGGAPGLHFYTLNLAKPSLNVLAKLA